MGARGRAGRGDLDKEEAGEGRKRVEEDGAAAAVGVEGGRLWAGGGGCGGAGVPLGAGVGRGVSASSSSSCSMDSCSCSNCTCWCGCEELMHVLWAKLEVGTLRGSCGGQDGVEVLCRAWALIRVGWKQLGRPKPTGPRGGATGIRQRTVTAKRDGGGESGVGHHQGAC